jgi:hypothetical protein
VFDIPARKQDSHRTGYRSVMFLEFSGASIRIRSGKRWCAAGPRDSSQKWPRFDRPVPKILGFLQNRRSFFLRSWIRFQDDLIKFRRNRGSELRNRRDGRIHRPGLLSRASEEMSRGLDKPLITFCSAKRLLSQLSLPDEWNTKSPITYHIGLTFRSENSSL